MSNRSSTAHEILHTPPVTSVESGTRIVLRAAAKGRVVAFEPNPLISKQSEGMAGECLSGPWRLNVNDAIEIRTLCFEPIHAICWAGVKRRKASGRPVHLDAIE
jgi:hypothetical protein